MGCCCGDDGDWYGFVVCVFVGCCGLDLVVCFDEFDGCIWCVVVYEVVEVFVCVGIGDGFFLFVFVGVDYVLYVGFEFVGDCEFVVYDDVD